MSVGEEDWQVDLNGEGRVLYVPRWETAASRGTMVGGDPRRAKIHGIGKLNVGYTEAKMLAQVQGGHVDT